MSETGTKKRGFLGRLFSSNDGDGSGPETRQETGQGPGPETGQGPGPETGHGEKPRAESETQSIVETIEAQSNGPQSSQPSPPDMAPAEPPEGAQDGDNAAAYEAAHEAAPIQAKKGWFSRLKDGLTKTSGKLSSGIASVFTKRKLDDDMLQELEDLLIQADLGVETATRITEALASERYDKNVDPAEVREILAREVETVLAPHTSPLIIDPGKAPHVVLVVGVNGSGKTTTIGKLAKQHMDRGLKVALAAGDTFRAAAIDQLKVWGERTGANVTARDVGADAAGLAFDALKGAREAGTDLLLIDTAGRLQNKADLMDELAKIVRVIRKIDPTAPHDVLLVLDATTGQNALNQVKVFKEIAGVTGLVMTKLDGTARGGILVAIASQFELPIHAIGVGEGIEDLQPFDALEFARAIAAE